MDQNNKTDFLNPSEQEPIVHNEAERAELEDKARTLGASKKKIRTMTDEQLSDFVMNEGKGYVKASTGKVTSQKDRHPSTTLGDISSITDNSLIDTQVDPETEAKRKAIRKLGYSNEYIAGLLATETTEGSKTESKILADKKRFDDIVTYEIKNHENSKFAKISNLNLEAIFNRLENINRHTEGAYDEYITRGDHFIDTKNNTLYQVVDFVYETSIKETIGAVAKKIQAGIWVIDKSGIETTPEKSEDAVSTTPLALTHQGALKRALKLKIGNKLFDTQTKDELLVEDITIEKKTGEHAYTLTSVIGDNKPHTFWEDKDTIVLEGPIDFKTGKKETRTFTHKEFASLLHDGTFNRTDKTMPFNEDTSMSEKLGPQIKELREKMRTKYLELQNYDPLAKIVPDSEGKKIRVEQVPKITKSENEIARTALQYNNYISKLKELEALEKILRENHIPLSINDELIQEKGNKKMFTVKRFVGEFEGMKLYTHDEYHAPTYRRKDVTKDRVPEIERFAIQYVNLENLEKKLLARLETLEKGTTN